MEELLNKLIKKGWKPFGDEDVKEIKIYSDMDMECIYGKKKSDFYYFSPRKITSKESGLWQFVCENGMYKKSIISRDYFNTLGGCRITFRHENMAFWLIESALKDEDKLEKFLLDNIKV